MRVKNLHVRIKMKDMLDRDTTSSFFPLAAFNFAPGGHDLLFRWGGRFGVVAGFEFLFLFVFLFLFLVSRKKDAFDTIEFRFGRPRVRRDTHTAAGEAGAVEEEVASADAAPIAAPMAAPMTAPTMRMSPRGNEIRRKESLGKVEVNGNNERDLIEQLLKTAKTTSSGMTRRINQ